MRLEAGATRRVLGQIRLARQDLAQAEQELHTSLHIFEEMNSLYETGKSLFQLARLYQARGDSAHMQDRLAQSVSIFESLGARLDLARARELQSG